MERRRGRSGFTLTELILVMGLLATVMALATPTLSRFVSGRALQEETRRLLALTCYARSQAISRSLPMELWIDTETGEYGLNSALGYELEEETSIEWSLAEDLRFDVDQEWLDNEGKATILFWPDGSIDVGSIERLRVQEGEEMALEIALTENRLEYEVVETE